MCRLHVLFFLFTYILGWNVNGNGGGSDPFANGTLASYGHAPALSRRSTETELEFHLRETEQLLEISLLKKKLRETETAMSNIIAKMGTVPKAQVRQPFFA